MLRFSSFPRNFSQGVHFPVKIIFPDFARFSRPHFSKFPESESYFPFQLLKRRKNSFFLFFFLELTFHFVSPQILWLPGFFQSAQMSWLLLVFQLNGHPKKDITTSILKINRVSTRNYRKTFPCFIIHDVESILLELVPPIWSSFSLEIVKNHAILMFSCRQS